MNKAEQFYETLTNVLGDYNPETIKTFLNDSTFNNRTVSVNQVIRFLRYQNSRSLRSLAIDLQTTYDSLRWKLTQRRSILNKRRTDAVDINEFVRLYAIECIVNPTFRRSLGHKLTSF